MKHNSVKIAEYKKELVKVFSKASNGTEMTEFLFDILTPAEFETLALRWQIVKRLNKGITHREIAGELGLGVGTVNRGARELRNKKGGFSLMLKKLGK